MPRSPVLDRQVEERKTRKAAMGVLRELEEPLPLSRVEPLPRSPVLDSQVEKRETRWATLFAGDLAEAVVPFSGQQHMVVVVVVRRTPKRDVHGAQEPIPPSVGSLEGA